MNITDLPNKAKYAAAMRKLRALAAANPNARVKMAWNDNRTASEAVRACREALNLRINERGGLPTRWDEDQINRWYRDRNAIRDYRLARIVRRGSGLETAEGRRVAPDVHERFTDRDW